MKNLKYFVTKNRKLLAWLAAALLLIAIFVVSVAGSLRVFLPYSSDLTGFPFGHKRYLVLFQNNAELRPTGGFISSFAIVDFWAGIPKIEISDVYGYVDDHERLPAPYPMDDLLADESYKGYSFRDGNFNPDFPASAKELLRLHKLTKPEVDFDGVIAVNFSALQDILAAVGPVKIDNQYIDKDNVFEKITVSVNNVDRHNLEALAARKSILKPLANALLWKVALNPFKLRKISDTITTSLSKKDLQLYFISSGGLKKLAENNRWDGSWPEKVEADFLAVNEANLGGMKSDRYIKRKISYQIKFSEDALKGITQPEAEVNVEMQHFGIENVPLSGPYSGYLRFYNSPDFNKPVADQIVKLKPGESTVVTKNYLVTKDVFKNNHYSLYLEKQSGTEDYYSVTVEFPRGYQISSDEFDARENIAFYEGQLLRDIKLDLNLLPDSNPPFLVLQENRVLNLIDLHFNEDMNQDFLSDPFSYSVRDTNLKNSGITDQLKIVNIKTTSKDVELELSGQTAQPEERYIVELKNLRDNHGNVISSREITVVQRVNN